MITKTQLAWAFFICLSISRQTLAQDRTLERQSDFRVGIGTGYSRTIDLQYSANVFETIIPNLSLGFTRRGAKGVLNTDLDAGMGSMRSAGRSNQTIYITDTDFYGNDNVEVHTLAYKQMRLQFELGYLHDVAAFSNTLKITLGGALVENFTYTPGIIYPGTINYASLNAKTGVDWRLSNGKHLNFGFSFPVLSLVTRMPYHNSPVFPDKTNLQAFFTGNNTWASVNQFQNANLSAKYEWYTGKRISMDVKLLMSWLHYNNPQPLTCAGTQLSLGINF